MLNHLKRFAPLAVLITILLVGFPRVHAQTATPHGIELTWTAPTIATGEPALAGFNVYRTVGSGTATKLNTALVTSPSYLDPNADLTAGMTYSYDVTAVDVNGNESAPSNVFAITPTVLIVNPPAPSGCKGVQQ
jgi:fibronectin type 3 domain-containing protein